MPLDGVLPYRANTDSSSLTTLPSLLPAGRTKAASQRASAAGQHLTLYSFAQAVEIHVPPSYPASPPKGSGASYDLRIAREALDQTRRLIFRQLVDEWFYDTQWLSSISAITCHDAFARLVALDKPVLKLILERLAQGEVRVHWFPVLKDVAGEDPVPPEKRGRVREMADEWLNWGRAKGLVRG